MSVLLGNGDGTFQAATDLRGRQPRLSRWPLADLNGDGKPDLAVANAGTRHGERAAGQRRRHLPGRARLSRPEARLRSVAVGDLNGDGKPDLAVANARQRHGERAAGQRRRHLPGRDDLTPPATGPARSPSATSTATASPTSSSPTTASNTVSVLLGNGDGTFQAATTYAVGSAPTSVAIGDLNGDGEPDIAVANTGSDAVSVLLNTPPTLAGPAYTIDKTAPTLTAVAETPSTGDLNAGKTVTITLGTSEAVRVTGSPTLTLNDGGTASYDTVKSSATSLVFDYTVGASDTNVASLAVTSVNLPIGATIQDGGGNNASLSLTGLTQSGPQIDTDANEQTALSLAVNGGHPIGIAIAGAVPFTVGGLESDDSGTVSFSDGRLAAVVVNIANGVPAASTVNLTGLTDGTITATLHLNNDAAGNSFTNVVTNSTLDQDTGEQAALALTVDGKSATPIGAAGARTVAFTIAGLEPEDAGTVTVNDANGKTVAVHVTGSQSSYTVDLNSLADGTITSSLAVNADSADNSFAPVSGNAVALDTTLPKLVSITQTDPTLTNASAVHYTVTFSELVTGVDAS